MNLSFLIIDGYPKESRDELKAAGMKTAWQLYAAMLKKYLAQAKYKVWFPCDTAEPPDGLGPAHYRGILWTGCNLTIYHLDDQRVRRQIEFAKRSYEAGAPAFGTCWGLQMAAVAAGGQVKANPKGREMGLARKIHLTKAGLTHPMMKDKPPVFCGFISHLDEVVKLPKGADLLATNDFTRVQAISVRHKKGLFWATQYHPEYNLHDMARLLTARSKKLLAEGFFTEKKDLTAYIAKLETLHQNPRRKDLRWQLDIDDDVLSQNIRQLEFANWLELALNVE